MLDTHESPVRETISIVVKSSRSCQDTPDAVRAFQHNLHISSSVVLRSQLDCNMFELLEIRQIQRVRCHFEAGLSAFLRNLLVDLDLGYLIPRLRLHELPLPCSLHDAVRVDFSVAVLVIVRSTGMRDLPVWVVGVDLNGSLDTEILHVPPGELWPHFEHKCVYSSCDRCSGRSSAMVMRAFVLSDIGGVLDGKSARSY